MGRKSYTLLRELWGGRVILYCGNYGEEKLYFTEGTMGKKSYTLLRELWGGRVILY